MTRREARRLLRMAWVGLLLAATTWALACWVQVGLASTVDGAGVGGAWSAQGIRLVQASEENFVETSSEAALNSASV